jgi:probable rRNA maturation factor
MSPAPNSLSTRIEAAAATGSDESSDSTEPHCCARRRSSPPDIEFSIDAKDAKLKFRTTGLAPRIRAAVAEIDADFSTITVRIAGDAEMTRLHAAHCGKRTTTDVLTFVLSDPGRPIEADIVVCADEAARQARARNHTVERELLLYIVHGLLHCAGFDDHDPADHDAMHAQEDRILRAIGVGATFARSTGTPSRTKTRSRAKAAPRPKKRGKP